VGKTIDVEALPAAAGADAALVERIATLVNEVYAEAEKGLWVEGATRTTPEEVAGLVGAGEIAVARSGGAIVGCIRTVDLDARGAEFGMMAAAADRRGEGIGRELVRFAEHRARRSGRRAMRLELLTPRGWTHPTKEFLAQWYARLGYRVERRATIDESYPRLADLLATPCEFVIYRKALAGPDAAAVAAAPR
jgi:GNAT superfamily N-acetyltransferase